MKQQIDYLIMLEHVNREMDTAVSLKALLENAGKSVVIGSIYFDFWRIVARYRPRVVIVPWAYANASVRKYTRFTPADSRGFHLLNLHHEQLIQIEDTSNFLLPKEQAKDVVHISWGRAFSTALESAGVDKGLIRETGSPRLDFYRPEMRGLFLGKKDLADKFLLDVEKPWVLLVGSFAMAQTKSPLFACKEDLWQRALIRRSFEGIVAWILSYLSKNKVDVELIYRPHPSEAVSKTLAEISEKNASLHVIPNLPIREWILNCDKIFVWRSTSAVEALAANKPVYKMNPIKELIADYDTLPILDDIPVINTAEDFVHVCNEHETDCRTSPKWQKAIAQMEPFFSTFDTPAVISIAQEALSLIDDPNARWFPQSYMPLWKKKTYLLQNNLKLEAYKRGVLQKMPHYFAQYRDYFAEDDVISQSEKMKRYLLSRGIMCK